MPCVCVTGPQEEATLGSAGWTTPEELSEQASQAQHLERLAQLCIMSKQPHLALEYSGKATKIHQRAFGNDHPITARSLELMATVYAEIGKTEYSDSLGQCVSALSKRFAAAESLRDSVSCLPHSHREKHSEVRHRKDTHHHQEDTLKPKLTNSKVPTSILKKPSSNYGLDTELNHKRKGERRVRFREPETTVHAYETTPSRPHLALFTCLFLLMSFLGVAMYCTDRRRPQRVCEELEATLAVYLLHMKQLLWGCWIWLTMQWLLSTTGGDMEPLLIYYYFFFLDPSFSYLWRCPGLQTPQPFGKALHTVCGFTPLSPWKREKCVIPEICSFHVCMYICTKVVGMPLHI